MSDKQLGPKSEPRTKNLFLLQNAFKVGSVSKQGCYFYDPPLVFPPLGPGSKSSRKSFFVNGKYGKLSGREKEA